MGTMVPLALKDYGYFQVEQTAMPISARAFKNHTRKEENKMQEPSNFQSKDSCRFFNANWLVKMLIMNSDQNL